jgi:tellurite resistance protein TerC
MGWTCALVAMAACFCLWIGWREGAAKALEFASSYMVEGSLSVDNLFVFLVLFRTRGLTHKQQHQALLWGIGGAMLMRAGMILLGIDLLKHFAWVQYLMGAFLLYAALRLFREKQPRTSAASHLVERPKAVSAARLFLLTIIAVELSDVAFALDSIPAVLAITRDPFVAYTSNIFAILGLRSLYLALSHYLDKLRGLHYGLAVILGLIGFKMLLERWLPIPTLALLAVILTILAVSLLLSVRAQHSQD